MTTKSGTNGREAKVQGAIRGLFRDSVLPGDTARKLGVVTTADSLSFGHELAPLVREAGRAPGFGSDPIDEAKIRPYLIATFGAGWRHDRPPHKHERGGGDPRLDQLYDVLDAALAELERSEGALWAAKDERAAVFKSDEMGKWSVLEQEARGRQLLKAARLAELAWIRAKEAASVARAAVGDRQREIVSGTSE